MDELIKRLAETSEGSRELDAEIAKSLGWRLDQYGLQGVAKWLAPGENTTQLLPHFTTSIDAKLPWEEKLWWSIHSPNGFPPYDKWEAICCTPDGPEFKGEAKTEALARRIACLKARKDE